MGWSSCPPRIVVLWAIGSPPSDGDERRQLVVEGSIIRCALCEDDDLGSIRGRPIGIRTPPSARSRSLIAATFASCRRGQRACGIAGESVWQGDIDGRRPVKSSCVNQPVRRYGVKLHAIEQTQLRRKYRVDGWGEIETLTRPQVKSTKSTCKRARVVSQTRRMIGPRTARRRRAAGLVSEAQHGLASITSRTLTGRASSREVEASCPRSY